MKTLFKNYAAPTVAAAVVTTPAAGTSEAWQISTTTALPPAATGVSQFVAQIAAPAGETSPELVLVTNINDGTHVQAQRGYSGSTIKTHAVGAVLTPVADASWLSSVEASRGAVFNVTDPVYGAKFDGTTNDTVAIQAALTACGNAGGGTVQCPAGTAVISATLALPHRVWLRGQGTWGTVLFLASSSNCAMVAPHTSTGSSDPNAEYTGLLDLTLHGNKAGQTSGHGWYQVWTRSAADYYGDPRHLIQNVRFYNIKNDAINMSGNSDVVAIRPIIQFCDGSGITTSFDTYILEPIIESAGCRGIYIQNGAVSVIGGKIFNCGVVTSYQGSGIECSGAEGAISLVGVSCQNNAAAGFTFYNTSSVTGAGLIADSNNMANSGYCGFEFQAGSSNCTIHGMSTEGLQGGVQVGYQANALRFTGSSNNNTVVISHASLGAPATVGAALSSDTVLLNNNVMVNGVSLTTGLVASGTLGANLTAAGTLFTIPTLAIGTWLVTVAATAYCPVSSSAAIATTVTTGTATITGASSSEVETGAGSLGESPLTLTMVVVVTVIATLTVAFTRTGTAVIQAAGVNQAKAGASGWTALKVV